MKTARTQTSNEMSMRKQCWSARARTVQGRAATPDMNECTCERALTHTRQSATPIRPLALIRHLPNPPLSSRFSRPPHLPPAFASLLSLRARCLPRPPLLRCIPPSHLFFFLNNRPPPDFPPFPLPAPLRI